VILRLSGESDEGHTHFTTGYGDERVAELELFGLPLVPEAILPGSATTDTVPRRGRGRLW
jgi:hypothetical protein